MKDSVHDHDAISRKLRAHGEAFMRMFDDSGDEREERQGPAATLRTAITEADIAESADVGRNTINNGRQAHTILEELDFPIGTTSQHRRTSNNGKPGGASLSMSLKKQRCLIMSGRSLHQQTSVSRVSRPDDSKRTDPDRDITAVDFEKMRKEVDTLGASALGKRQRKDFETSLLTSVNAKVQKSPRIPASIGQGLAKKRKQREEAARELAIEAGMMQRKGLAKKRKQARKASKKGVNSKKRP